VSSTHTVTVLRGFESGPTDGNPPSLEFSIPYLRNPRSVSTSGTFNVTIFDYTGEILYFFNETLANETAPTVSMVGYSAPNNLYLQRSTEQNGLVADYYIQLQSSNYIQESDIIWFKLPDGVRFSLDTECFENSTQIGKQLPCDISSD